jgi:hypothetical protein
MNRYDYMLDNAYLEKRIEQLAHIIDSVQTRKVLLEKTDKPKKDLWIHHSVNSHVNVCLEIDLPNERFT